MRLSSGRLRALEGSCNNLERRKHSSAFSSPFGTLSLLDVVGDDSSSLTGSVSIHSMAGYMSGLDNEVEILYFPSGSVLAQAGERNTGRFSIIYLSVWMNCIQDFSTSSTAFLISPSRHPMPPSVLLILVRRVKVWRMIDCCSL